MGILKKLFSRSKIEPSANTLFLDSTFEAIYFDGEKTPYELGRPKDLILDYYSLRVRSWQSYIESDVVQNAIKKYCLWIVGPGLKLQSQPNEFILTKNGIDIKSTNFVDEVENQFRLFANSNHSSYSGMENLHSLASEALKNALLAGDVLCINRFDGKKTTIELIDGYAVQSPFSSEAIDKAKEKGNEIIQGVEIDKKGTHIAYYVRNDTLEFQRIEARDGSDRLKAWLFYGLKHKINDVRGMSLLTAILETASKLDRYKDATIGAAEENAKIPYEIRHNQFSDGENPMIAQVVQSFQKGKGTAPETNSYDVCETGGYATKVAQSTGKTTYNMPIGSSLNRHSGSSDLHFKDFFGINIDIIYATIGIPPEVALDRFSGAYSGSRAALKSWEYKMVTDRIILLKNQFYKPFYDFWLDINVLLNNITAPGYLKALMNKAFMILEAYRNSRFIGATVPHIDPLKEVNAERRKLGKSFDNIPITTGEQVTENLNTGDFDQVIKKAQDEKKKAKSFDDVANSNVVNTGTSKVS